jgi:hypothetical protein
MQILRATCPSVVDVWKEGERQLHNCSSDAVLCSGKACRSGATTPCPDYYKIIRLCHLIAPEVKGLDGFLVAVLHSYQPAGLSPEPPIC